MALIGKIVVDDISVSPNPVNVGNQLLVRVKVDIIPIWFTYNDPIKGYNISNWQRNYIDIEEEGGVTNATSGRVIRKGNSTKY